MQANSPDLLCGVSLDSHLQAHDIWSSLWKRVDLLSRSCCHCMRWVADASHLLLGDGPRVWPAQKPPRSLSSPCSGVTELPIYSLFLLENRFVLALGLVHTLPLVNSRVKKTM